MHVLPRPHLPRAIAVTAIAAGLAIILTLAIAGRLSDVGSSTAPASAPGPVASVQAPAARSSASVSPLIRSPFSSRLSAPVTPAWAQNSR